MSKKIEPLATPKVVVSEPVAAQTPSESAPKSTKSWKELGLSEVALELIAKAGFESPTPVQSEAIPAALSGKDVMASAQTGTGKTLSFVAPMVERCAGRSGTYGLVLCPTREIAQQTHAAVEQFGGPRGVHSGVLIGGIDIKLDNIALQKYPQILVATPGRLCDHLDRGNIWLEYIEVVVLDEADRMLDMGFSDQLTRIMRDVPPTSQKLLFSATIPPQVDQIARKFMRNPERIAIGKPLSAATTVTQRFVYVTEESRNSRLRELLREEKGSIIVFTRSKDGATRLWRSLHSSGIYDAAAIHSNLLQKHREQALAEFKSGKVRILIATDVAARGIHVDEVAHVVNFELPMEPEDYVHRIGRTGRAQMLGKATSFVTHRDGRTLREIERILGNKISVEGMPAAGESGPAGSHSSERHSRGRRPGPSGGGRPPRRR